MAFQASSTGLVAVESGASEAVEGHKSQKDPMSELLHWAWHLLKAVFIGKS